MNRVSNAARAVGGRLTSAIAKLRIPKGALGEPNATPFLVGNYQSGVWRLFLLSLILISTIGVFVLDILTPLGFSIWILYLVPLWLTAYYPSERSPLLLPWVSAVVASLIIAGFWLSPPGISLWLAAANRALVIVMIGFTTFLLRRLILQSEVMVRNEAELRDFVEGASVGLHWVGPDATILWANQAELSLLGYAPEEYVGHSIREFHVDADIVEDILTRLLSGETLYNYEARLRCKDGRIRHVSIASNASWRGGRFSHSRCFTRDITAQKEAERLQARLAAIVTHSEDAIISFTPDGMIETWNKGAERLLGWTEAEACGRSKRMFVPSDYISESRRLVEAARQGQPARDVATRRKRKDGSLVDVSITMSPVLVDDRLVSFCEILRDMTEWKRSEERLVAANKELESFSYSVSHDLRAPLRSIDGFAKVLVEDFGPALPTEARRYLSIIQRGAGRMGNLIDDLLEFSRLSRSTLTRQAVDTKRLIREVWLELRRVDPDRPAELIMDDVPNCIADRRLIRQVWVNLLSNALKYSHPRQESRIEIGWHQEELQPHNAVYWIRDNGVGFDQQYVHKLFGVFQRLHRAEDFEGTGVGLALVHRIIQRHGGRVWAEGRVNEGATFSFTLERAYEYDRAGTHLGVVGRG